MKTLLGYLTFAALLTLCYIEKINAEAAKRQVRDGAIERNAPGQARTWAEEDAAVAQVRE